MKLPSMTGAALRKMRESLGLTREQFAEPLLVDAERIRDMERGTVNVRAPFWLLTNLTYDLQFRGKWFEHLNRRT